MAEVITIKADSRKEMYEELIPQIRGLVTGEEDTMANISNVIAALKQTFNFFWVGIYFVKKDELVLGPFQGSVACTRIKKGQGVCGYSWSIANSVIVPDVDLFPGHIACSSLSRSEIVVPVINENKEVVAVLDVDSDKLYDFNKVDQKYLEEIAAIISTL